MLLYNYQRERNKTEPTGWARIGATKSMAELPTRDMNRDTQEIGGAYGEAVSPKRYLRGEP